MVDVCTKAIMTKTLTPFIRWELQNLSEVNKQDSLKINMKSNGLWVIGLDAIDPRLNDIVTSNLEIPCCLIPSPKYSIAGCNGLESSAYNISLVEILSKTIDADLTDISILSIAMNLVINDVEYPSIALKSENNIDQLSVTTSKLAVKVSMMISDCVSKGYVTKSKIIEFDMDDGHYTIGSIRMAVVNVLVTDKEIEGELKETLRQVVEMAGLSKLNTKRARKSVG